MTLQRRHNGRDGVSNHQPPDCFLNVYSRRWSKKHQSSASLAFVRGIRRWPVNSPHKRPVTRKMFSIDDVIMESLITGPCTKAGSKMKGSRSRVADKCRLGLTQAIFLMAIPEIRFQRCLFHLYRATGPYKRKYSEKNGISKRANTNHKHTYNNNDILNEHTICTQFPMYAMPR